MKRTGRGQQLLIGAILAASFAFFLLPILWVVSTSLKSAKDVFARPPVLIPTPLNFQNYSFALQHGGVQGIRDSLIVAVGTTVVSLALGAFAAYGMARFKVGGDSFSFWVLSMRMAPPIAVALPLFMMFRGLHLLDTYWALIIAYTAFNLPFVIWLLSGFFEDVPKELDEAALVDGCGPFGAFVRVALPLTAPGLVATAFFCFIFGWNEFLFALIMTRSEVKPLPIAIFALAGGHEVRWNEIAAMAMMAVVPVLIFALLLQRYLVRGLTFGGVKG